MGMFDVVLEKVETPKVEVMFSEKDHKYTHPITGEVIPSTSQVNLALGISKDISKITNLPHPMGWYADRGTLAHLGMEMYCNGEKDLSVIVEELRKASAVMTNGVDFKEALPYLESGIKFMKEYTNVEVVECEKQFLFDVGDDELYAGTADLVGEHKEKGTIVFDWKTSSDVNKEHYKLQIAAYALRVDAKVGGIVQLDKDGGKAETLWVDLKPYTDKWIKLVKLYHSDMDDKEKKAEAQRIIKDAIEIDDDVAEKLVTAKATETKAKTEVDTLKKSIIGDTKGQNFMNANSGVNITWCGKETPVLDDESYWAEINKVTGNKYSELLESYEKATAELTSEFEAGREAMLAEAGAPAIEKKHTTYELSGSYRLTFKKKSEDKPKPKTEKKEPEQVTVKDVCDTAEKENEVKAKVKAPPSAEQTFNSKIARAEHILKEKRKLSKSVVEVFKLNCELMFKKKWDSPEMESQKGDTIVDLADQAIEANILKMAKVFEQNKTLPEGK